MTTCPKCEYRRKPTDDVPDWQCPRCGVAYNKVMATNGNARLQAGVNHNSNRKTPPAPTMEVNAFPWKLLLPLVILVAVGFGIWKVKHPSTATIANEQAAQFAEAKRDFDNNNIHSAMKLFAPLAEQGNAKAQYYLGRTYSISIHFSGGSGKDLVPDYDKVIYWLEKAAKQGDAPAQVELGKLYERGIVHGIDKDPAKAKSWYEMAAAQNDRQSQFRLGVMQEESAKVEFDYKLAAKWYRLAANQGSAGALLNLGKFYAEGKGVEQNGVTAYALLTLADEKFTKHIDEGEGFWASSLKESLAKKISAEEQGKGLSLAAAIANGASIPE